MKFFKVTAKPTVLHCLDCTLYRYCHYYMLLLMLTPLGFHSNILLRFNCEKKRVNLWSSSLYGRFHFHNCEKYYPNTVNNSPCGGFQSDWNVLPEHVEFASLGFIWNWHWILTRQSFFQCCFEIHNDKWNKNKDCHFKIWILFAESKKNTM